MKTNRNGFCHMLVFAALPGCVALNPGGQVREGFKQSGSFGWTSEGFKNEFLGSQEFGFTMIEGSLVMTENEDGEAVPDYQKSVITAYLNVTPRQGQTGAALGAGFEASTAQVQAMTQLIQALAPMIGSRPPPP